MSYFAITKGLYNGNAKEIEASVSGSLQTVSETPIVFGFETTTPLAGGAVFTSDWINISHYQQVQTNIVSNVNGTMKFEFATGPSVGEVVRTLNIAYDSTQGFQLLSAPCFTAWVRYSYTNGPTPQTSFSYNTKLLVTGLSPQVLPINGTLNKSMVATVNRSVIVGQDLAGNFRNAGVDSEGHLKVNLDEPLTAFGELKVAELSPYFQITHPYGLNLDVVRTGSQGAGVVTYETSSNQVLITATGANSSASLQSIKLGKYRNGQGLDARFTCVFGTGTTGNMQVAGWGDNLGGFFFGYSGSSFGIIQRSSGSADIFTSQSSWNIDTMDGTNNALNPSGQLLDPTKGNVYDIQVQWLGYGAIKFAIESSETGQFEPVHQIEYANTYTTPSTLNPTFPVSFISTNTTNTSAVQMKNASMACFVEGQIKYTGMNYAQTGSSGASANKNILTLFNPPTFNGVINKTVARIRSLSLIADGTQTVNFSLIKNATINTPTYIQGRPYSPIQQDIAGTYVAGTGRSTFDQSLNKTDSAQTDLTPYEIFINPGETLSVISVVGTNAGVFASLSWIDDI